MGHLGDSGHSLETSVPPNQSHVPLRGLLVETSKPHSSGFGFSRSARFPGAADFDAAGLGTLLRELQLEFNMQVSRLG